MSQGLKRCDFCGRSSAEVRLLVPAPSGDAHICLECASRVHELVVEPPSTFRPALKPTSPRDIKRSLDDYVVEQEDAKRSLALN